MAEFFNTGLSQQQFLDQYWQKKPLLIRQAYPEFVSPITPEELAGSACEPEIESRLIQQHGDTGMWQLDNGPFDESVFSGLANSHWTLLVQDVDKHLPELAPLLDSFRFVPDWRLDDLMISYAVDQGSVGPHTDGYDVFLVQAYGKRHWHITAEPVTEPELLEDIDLRILKEFKADADWVLSPGDILYLPPHYAHHGVALGDCMTFSVGFRAPKQVEILDAFTNSLLERGKGQEHYGDSDLKPREQGHEIDDDARQNLKQILHHLIEQSDDILLEAFGKLVTETKESMRELATEFVGDEWTVAEIDAEFNLDKCLIKNPYVRFAWLCDKQAQLFISGEAYSFDCEDKDIVSRLAEASKLSQKDWLLIRESEAVTELFCELLADGVWHWQQG